MTSSNYDALELDNIPNNPYCSHGTRIKDNLLIIEFLNFITLRTQYSIC